MKPQISSSDLAIFSDNYREKAWHLAAILFSIGRPASPAELVGKCSLFQVSPEFVEFICSIPHSPILLTGNNFVLPSMVAFMAAVEFFAISKPKVQIGPENVRRLCGDVVRTYYRKRKKIGSEVMPIVKKRAVMNYVDDNERENFSTFSSERTVKSCFQPQVVNLHTHQMGRVLDTLPFGLSTKGVNLEVFGNIIAVPQQQQQDCPYGSTLAMTHSVFNSNVGLLGYQSNNEEEPNSGNKPDLPKVVWLEEHSDLGKDNVTISGLLDLDREKTTAPLLESLAEISAMLDETRVEQTTLINRIDTVPSCIKPEQQNRNTLTEAPSVINALDNYGNDTVDENRIEELAELPRMVHDPQEEVQKFSFSSCEKSKISPQKKLCSKNLETSNGSMLAFKNEILNTNGGSEILILADKQFVTQKSRAKISATMKNIHQDKLIKEQPTPSKSLQHGKVDVANETLKGHKDHCVNSIKQKSKSLARSSAFIQEKCSNAHKSPKDQQGSKSFPEFDTYLVEEEEGSGGYGTVYRARRKSDGVTFAIKCPHVNAHKHHVKNELKMLERFGGRNFVIKYEGSIKNASSDCFVLEHVEHDRPEVLRREINVFQLQWYGYCMFRALASLHKQGVFHRDVKPGNFLFSCKSNNGYLIDFNLAKDMHQKHENAEKTQTSYPASHQQLLALQSKSVSPSKRRKILSGKSSKLIKAVAASGSNLENNSLKRKSIDKLKAYDDLGRRNSLTSQGAEASGLTSAKDLTPSAEKLREPLPCQGRKELINLAQEAMQNPNIAAVSAPVSKRKRVAASPGIIDKKFVYISPMPLHSSGISIFGAGSLKSKDIKTHKEGPCAGTKGFRAPEILLRSLHQGPKVDVWSAGVTLLYLITGKMAFSGEPEQNMKDIVKLRGNEELWEVAKLHNREPSFPVDLLDVRYLSSTTIKDWCVANTKRPDFLELIPESLFDLIEKCLTVNPRLRITAEEALRHEFFAPCHEALRRQRSLRRGPNQDIRSNTLSIMDEVSTSKHASLTYEHSISPVKMI